MNVITQTTHNQPPRPHEAVPTLQQLEFVGIDEASQVLGVTIRTLYKLTCKREIPHYKLRGRLYFDIGELNEWIRRHKVKSREELLQEAEAVRAIATPIRKQRSRR